MGGWRGVVAQARRSHPWGGALPVHDTTLGEVVRGKLHQHAIAKQDLDVVAADLAGDVGEDSEAVVEVDPEHCVRE